MIDPATIQRIYDAIDIVDVVKDYVSLKKKRGKLSGLCPFTMKKRLRLPFRPARVLFKCFGCGKGGNAVNFIMEHEHLSYVEALRLLPKSTISKIVKKLLRRKTSASRMNGKVCWLSVNLLPDSLPKPCGRGPDGKQ
jgi:DNA primase